MKLLSLNSDISLLIFFSITYTHCLVKVVCRIKEIYLNKFKFRFHIQGGILTCSAFYIIHPQKTYNYKESNFKILNQSASYFLKIFAVYCFFTTQKFKFSEGVFLGIIFIFPNGFYKSPTFCHVIHLS